MTRRHFVEQIVTIYALFFLGGLLIFGSMLAYIEVFGQAKSPAIPANPANLQASEIIPNAKPQEQKLWYLLEPPPGYNQPSAQSLGGTPGEIMGYVSAGLAAYSTWQSKKAKDDVKKIEPVVQEIQPAVTEVKQKVEQTQAVQKELAETQVKVINTQEKTVDQIYENMGEAANQINDKPEIRKVEIAKLKEAAVKTTAKA